MLGAINVAGPQRARPAPAAERRRPRGRDAAATRATREITVAGVPCRAIRAGFVGEVVVRAAPSALAGRRALGRPDARAAADLGVRPHGLDALDVLRLEKGHIYLGQDTLPDDHPVEAGPGLDAWRWTSPRSSGKVALERMAGLPDGAHGWSACDFDAAAAARGAALRRRAASSVASHRARARMRWARGSDWAGSARSTGCSRGPRRRRGRRARRWCPPRSTTRRGRAFVLELLPTRGLRRRRASASPDGRRRRHGRRRGARRVAPDEVDGGGRRAGCRRRRDGRRDDAAVAADPDAVVAGRLRRVGRLDARAATTCARLFALRWRRSRFRRRASRRATSRTCRCASWSPTARVHLLVPAMWSAYLRERIAGAVPGPADPRSRPDAGGGHRVTGLLARARRSCASDEVKPHYDVVIVGGGVNGLSLAYHLAAHHGITNVGVFERAYIGVGRHRAATPRSSARTTTPRDRAALQGEPGDLAHAQRGAGLQHPVQHPGRAGPRATRWTPSRWSATSRC